MANRLKRLLKLKNRDKVWQDAVEQVVFQMEQRVQQLEQPTPNN